MADCIHELLDSLPEGQNALVVSHAAAICSYLQRFCTVEVTDAAQSVQRSAFPDAYADHEQMARSFSSALGGYSPASLTCRLNPATDEDAAGATAAVTATAGTAE